MVTSAVEGHMGMLTCQVIELGVRLQSAHAEIADLRARLAEITAAAEAAAP